MRLTTRIWLTLAVLAVATCGYWLVLAIEKFAHVIHSLPA